MTEKQKEAILEIQDLILAINAVVKKYEMEDEFISCIAIGFLDMESSYVDEDGDERANMSLLSSFSVSDDEELDDLLSYCVEAYTEQVREEKKSEQSSIDYWINLSKRDGDVN